MKNYKKISLMALFFTLLFPITNALAFVHIDKLNNAASVFFLVDLDVGDNIEITIVPNENGNFAVFLFNERPTETNVNGDKTLNKKIYDNTVAYSLSSIPTINYKASKKEIYYVQVILLDNGPDTFVLTCNKELSRYYLPQIPGYPLEFLTISLFIALGLILVLYRKKAIKI
ncbi:MAG: Loki-CTERM sorting domain-containing protein [Promethearchaeota archaeon]